MIEMRRIERLVAEIKRQLFPYSHASDVERSCERWDVDIRDCMTSWMVEQIKNCRKKNGCDGRERCSYYSHGDLAKRNYEICREMSILMESGEISCVPSDNELKE